MGPVIFSYILSLRQPSGTWGYVPNRTESRKKQRGSGEEGAEKWRRKGCTSRPTGLQQAWQPCLGSSRTHTPWETPRRLGTETFSNSLAVQKSLSASQACLCHNLGAFCSEQPVLGLHFKASTEGSNSRLLWLSLPWDDPCRIPRLSGARDYFWAQDPCPCLVFKEYTGNQPRLHPAPPLGRHRSPFFPCLLWQIAENVSSGMSQEDPPSTTAVWRLKRASGHWFVFDSSL